MILNTDILSALSLAGKVQPENGDSNPQVPPFVMPVMVPILPTIPRTTLGAGAAAVEWDSSGIINYTGTRAAGAGLQLTTLARLKTGLWEITLTWQIINAALTVQNTVGLVDTTLGSNIAIVSAMPGSTTPLQGTIKLRVMVLKDRMLDVAHNCDNTGAATSCAYNIFLSAEKLL